MTEAEVRAFALALPEAEEKPHFERAAFRVRGGRIFATLGGGIVNLKLVPEQAMMLIEAEPETFLSLGGWTRRGHVGVRLDAIDADRFEMLLRDAWRNAAPKRLLSALVRL